MEGYDAGGIFQYEEYHNPEIDKRMMILGTNYISI
jgi:hypothetical protein